MATQENSRLHLTDGMIRANPVLSLDAWGRFYWKSHNSSESKNRIAEKLHQWIDAGVRWPAHETERLVAAGLLPSQTDFLCKQPTPRVVGLIYDPLNKWGLVNPLVTKLSESLSGSPLLPFPAETIRSLLLQLCDCSENALNGGIPEAIGLHFDETLKESCTGNSMTVAGLLSALDALTRNVCPVFSAACAVVEQGFHHTLTPVNTDSIKAKLDAFVREYGTGSLLVACSTCEVSRPFHDKFEQVWLVDNLTELAAKIATVREVQEELTRSGPLNARQTTSVLGELAYLIHHQRDNRTAINLCNRLERSGFSPDVSQFKRWELHRHHADALRHSGRFKESLRVVAQTQATLEDCREILSLEDEADQAVAFASNLFDACDFESAARWLEEPLRISKDSPKSLSAQQRIEVYNTLARTFVMMERDGWEELFEESIRLQRIFDPANLRRTESYLLHACLRAGRLDEAEAIVERHEGDNSGDGLSKEFTYFYRSDLMRRRGLRSEPPSTSAFGYTTAFALQACARQHGRAADDRLLFLERAEQILLKLADGSEEGNLQSLIAAAISLTSAVYSNDAKRWTVSIARLSNFAKFVGDATQWYFSPTLDSLGDVPSIDACERLLRLVPYL